MSTSRIVQFLGALAFALCAVPAAAQDVRPGYGPNINIVAAKKIAAGVVAECASNKWNIAVAIVDTAGSLVYFERIEGRP